MTRVILSSLFIVLCLSTTLFAQREFIRVFKESVNIKHEYNPDLRAHPDGGLVCAIPVIEGVHKKVLIIKLNSCSEIVWSKIYYVPNRTYGYLDVDVSVNGDILLFGGKRFDRISSEGKVIRSKTIQSYGQGRLLKIRDILGGKRTVIFSDERMLIFDSNGEALYAESLLSNRNKAAVLNLKEGAYIVAHGPIIYKKSSEHKIIWKLKTDRKGFEFHRLTETSDGIVGTFSVIKNSVEVFYLFKMGHNGSIIWTSEGFSGWVRHVMVNNNDEIIAACHPENSFLQIIYHRFSMNKGYLKSELIDPGAIINSVRSSNNFLFSIGDLDEAGTVLTKHNADLESESCVENISINLLDTIVTNFYPFWDSTFHEVTTLDAELESQDYDISYENICEQEFFVSINEGSNQDTILCFQDSIILKSTYSLPLHNWSNGSDSSAIIASRAGTYWLEAGDECATQSDTFHLNYFPDPELAYRINPMVGDVYTEFKYISLTPFVRELKWDLGDSTLSNRELFRHRYFENGWYPVTYSFRDSFNCYFEDVSYVKVDFLSIQIPNSVTPNSDGLNDSFKPLGYGFKHYHMTIYNRWGEIVHRGDNSEWRPSKESQGKYLYDIRFIDDFGVGAERKGTVLLIR